MGRLSDVRTDFELVWQPHFTTFKDHHKVIASRFASVLSLLKCIPHDNHKVIGSKLVLSKKWYSRVSFADLMIAIEPEIRIIHLKRSPKQVLYSYIKSQGHRLRESSPENSNNKLISDIEKDKLKSAMEREISNYDFNKALHTLICIRRNDYLISRMSKHRENYFLIDYSNIESKWNDLCEYISSSSSIKEREKVINAPVTIQNRKLDLSEVISNSAEIEVISDIFSHEKSTECLKNFLYTYRFKSIFIFMSYSIWLLKKVKKKLYIRKRFEYIFK